MKPDEIDALPPERLNVEIMRRLFRDVLTEEGKRTIRFQPAEKERDCHSLISDMKDFSWTSKLRTQKYIFVWQSGTLPDMEPEFAMFGITDADGSIAKSFSAYGPTFEMVTCRAALRVLVAEEA